MRGRAALLAGLSTALVVAACGGALAKAKPLSARFLGSSTYTTGDGCAKLKALAAGGPRNIGTVPETLTAKGFDSWEGGCAFTKLTQLKAGKLYKATLACGEAAEDWLETDTFALSDDGAVVTVTVLGKDRKTTVYQRCDAPPAAKAAH